MESPYFDIEKIRDGVDAGLHRDVIGGEWDRIGRLQFDFLKDAGLKPHHSLLDVGCGCLRGGIHFIGYLDRGNYVGIDINQSLLVAGYDIELAKAGLQERLPRENLLCIGDFGFQRIGRRFDFALAQSLFTHLGFNHIRRCLESLADVMEVGGVFFATFFEAPRDVPVSESYKQSPGNIVTCGTADPYHYRLSDFFYATRGLPWRIQYIGDWGHPSGQRMLAFHRLDTSATRPGAEAITSPPASNSRDLDVDAASTLPPRGGPLSGLCRSTRSLRFHEREPIRASVRSRIAGSQ
jgi:SAM-dependent methyltransferase